MDDELGRMRREAVVAYYKVPSRNSSEGTEENHGKPQVRMAGVPAEIRTGLLSNAR
jgi:hypothetical protein